MRSNTAKEIALREATAWFVRLDSGEVSSETKADFFTWLDKDQSHQSAYIDVEKLWGKLDIVRQLPMESPSRRKNWLKSLFGATGAALAATVILGLAALIYLYPGAVTETRYATAVGERGDFRLADGSLLQLNTDSAVTVRMEKSQRLLTLEKGEVYFDIAHNADRPLLVQTNDGLVRVLGTRFNIHQTSSGSIVSVIEGLVAITTRIEDKQISNPDFKAKYTLAAHQQARLRKNQPVESPVAVNSDIVLAWREGKLVYEGNTLAEVVDDLNRYFPGTIRLSDPALGELEIVGVLNLSNRTATLAALEATFGVEVYEASENLTLIRPSQLSPK